eukprot:2937-Heterococcus_DN1.PRE.2
MLAAWSMRALNEKEQALLASEDDTGLLDLIKQMLLPSVTAMNVPVKAEFRLAGFFGAQGFTVDTAGWCFASAEAGLSEVDEAISAATEHSELARLRTLRAKLEKVLQGLGYCREG